VKIENQNKHFYSTRLPYLESSKVQEPYWDRVLSTGLCSRRQQKEILIHVLKCRGFEKEACSITDRLFLGNQDAVPLYPDQPHSAANVF